MQIYKAVFYRTAIRHTTKSSIPVERVFYAKRSTGLSDKKEKPEDFSRPSIAH